MAGHGLALVPAGARILTHCNTGAPGLGRGGHRVRGDPGRAPGGRLAQLWVDETRPLLQGARLTA